MAKESIVAHNRQGTELKEPATRVLLIESDPTQAGNLSHALVASGYEVAIAETAEVGVELASNYHPDAILLGQHGPQTEQGIELCARLKAAPDLAKVPVLVFDQSGARSYDDRALEAGIEEFIPTLEGAEGTLVRLKRVLRKHHLIEQLQTELDAAEREREMLRQTKESLACNYQQLQAQLERLKEENEKLRELDRVKSGFISMVVHDIRSPLTVIVGTLDLLREELATGRPIDYHYYQRLFDESLRNCQEIARLIDDMLTLAQIGERRLVLNFEPTTMNEIVEEAVQVAAGAARQAEVTLSCEIAAGLPLVYVDRKQMHRALMNLVNNAIKFTPAGGRVTIQARLLEEKRRDAPCDYVLLSVVDTGEGLAPEEAPYVFDAYWQASNGKWKTGTGLGLAIVKRIAVAHGGNASVRSQLGKGSTFTIMIPVREGPPTGTVELTE